MALVHYRCSLYINPTIGVGFVVELGVVSPGLAPKGGPNSVKSIPTLLLTNG